jgi:hypothetical protein
MVTFRMGGPMRILLFILIVLTFHDQTWASACFNSLGEVTHTSTTPPVLERGTIIVLPEQTFTIQEQIGKSTSNVYLAIDSTGTLATLKQFKANVQPHSIVSQYEINATRYFTDNYDLPISKILGTHHDNEYIYIIREYIQGLSGENKQLEQRPDYELLRAELFHFQKQIISKMGGMRAHFKINNLALYNEIMTTGNFRNLFKGDDLKDSDFVYDEVNSMWVFIDP